MTAGMRPELVNALGHLETLVGFDTQNPPRAITPDGIFDYLARQLPDFALHLNDYGDGCLTLLATRGQPQTVFNFHIDTVPAGPGWSGDPFALTVGDGRATGLGACDIKGAAACMLTATAATSGDLALLFSSDEEMGDSRCIRRFLAGDHGFKNAVIAEPTGAKAVLAHRGIATASMQFRGEAGHASAGRALDGSAVHRAVRWAGRALDLAGDSDDERYENLRGVRFNIGRVAGGIKPNMIAPRADVKFGVRPLPGQDGETWLARFARLAEPHEVAHFEPGFLAPSLPANGASAPADGLALARSLGLTPGDAVDFWTEAALFSGAGVTALVYGPGDIAQAHSADEWVALAQLDEAIDTYTRLGS